MRTFFISFSVSVVGAMMFIAPTMTQQLHEATVRQCMTHDWPSHQAEAHIKFCQQYLAEN
jgi:hypothetical protein